MTDERTTVEELDDLIEALIHELNGLQVRRRSIEELALHDQRRIVQLLTPFLGLVRGVRGRVDEKLSVILDARLDDEDDATL